MHEFEIKSLEIGQVLETVVADGFTIGEGGIVTFYKDVLHAVQVPSTGSVFTKKTTAVTQVSSSTIIIQKPTGKPAVVPFSGVMAKTIEAVTQDPLLHHQI